MPAKRTYLPKKRNTRSSKKTTHSDSDTEIETIPQTPKTVKNKTVPKTVETVIKYVEVKEPSSSTAAKSLKLPPFSAREIDFWFVQVEALFRNGNVTDDQSKFDFVISGLDVNVSSEIQDVLENPPAENKYQHLKTMLKKRLTASDERKIDRLLENAALGDRSPSQFLRFLRKEGKLTDDRVLKGIWKKALPDNVRLALAGRHLPLDELAEIADEIVDTEDTIASLKTTAAPRKSTGNGSGNAPDFEKTVLNLAKTMETLAREVKTMKERPRSRSREKGQETVCWYHRKFQEKSTRCQAPCTWKQGNGAAQQ